MSFARPETSLKNPESTPAARTPFSKLQAAMDEGKAMSTLHFGDFVLDTAHRQLLRGTQPVKLGGRAFDVLQLLASRAPAPVDKRELFDTVWPGLVVEENNLQVQVSALRKLLGNEAIVTIPGRGYCLTLKPRAGTADRAASMPAAPAAPVPIYGRTDDLRRVCDLLSAHRLVSITGAGGIGKTHLARAVLEAVRDRFPDGVFWIDLVHMTDAALLPATIAQALGLTVTDAPPPLRAAASLLRDQQALLVVDNCEHLVGAVAACLQALLPEAPHVRALTTTQEPLKIAPEVAYRLDVLGLDPPPGGGLPGAVELFVARVHQVAPRMTLDAAALAAATDICRGLDGIALAIELAAARVPLLGLEGLRARLHERFNVLTGGTRHAMRRHQTLRAALDWSHGLLSADEQAVFRRLGVFAGSFSLEQAQRVAGDAAHDRWQVLDLLGHLVDKSLVVPLPAADPRYRLLETTRAFALEKLAAADETQALLRRHALALLDELAAVDDQLNQPPPSAVRERVVAELDNLRAALQWAARHDRLLACRLMSRSWPAWLWGAQLYEGFSRCLALQPLPPDLLPADRAHFLLTQARCASGWAFVEGLQAAREAEQLFASLDMADKRIDACLVRAAAALIRGDTAEGGAAVARAGTLLRPDSPHRQRARHAATEGFLRAHEGCVEQALACCERAAAIARAHGDVAAVLIAETNATQDALAIEPPQQVIDRIERILAESRRNGLPEASSVLLYNLCWARALGDDPASALACAREALPHQRRDGCVPWIAGPVAMAHSRLGDHRRAATLIGYVKTEYARIGKVSVPFMRAWYEQVMAAARGALGDAEFDRCYAAGTRLNDDQAIVLGLQGSARGDARGA